MARQGRAIKQRRGPRARFRRLIARRIVALFRSPRLERKRPLIAMLHLRCENRACDPSLPLSMLPILSRMARWALMALADLAST